MKIIFEDRRCILTILVMVLSCCFIKSQSILFVDDNDFIVHHSDSMKSAIVKAGFNIDYYNVEQLGGLPPTQSLVNSYDILIWYASTDGDQLGFWTPTAQSVLKNYLELGNTIWLIGSDILFDKYPSTGEIFGATSFENKYLGIQKYDTQSYGDDGNLGCPQMDKTLLAPISFPLTIKWQLPTHWWIDGILTASNTIPYYMMGPSTYVLAGDVSMYVYQNNHTSLCTFFDPSLIDNTINRVSFCKASINQLIRYTSTKEQSLKINTIYPNPASDLVNIDYDGFINKIEIYNKLGQVQYLTYNQSINNITIDVSHLHNDLYFIKIYNKTNNSQIHKLTIAK